MISLTGADQVIHGGAPPLFFRYLHQYAYSFLTLWVLQIWYNSHIVAPDIRMLEDTAVCWGESESWEWSRDKAGSVPQHHIHHQRCAYTVTVPIVKWKYVIYIFACNKLQKNDRQCILEFRVLFFFLLFSLWSTYSSWI